MLLILSCILGFAEAAEVVWLSPASPEQQELVAQAAGAKATPMTPLELRAAATRASEADDAAYAALDATLADVRAYETRLDGELVIMRDLQGPIDAISLVRGDEDRDALFAALAYQGFAVNRFFDSTLADDPAAEPYRSAWDGWVVERPWLDAIALSPGREVSPYEIAENPQRVAFGARAEQLRSALPVTLTVSGLPSGGTWMVNGRPAEVTAAGNIKVPAGRHLVHVEVSRLVLARWDVRGEPGGVVDLEVPLDDEVWRAFTSGLADGSVVPDALVPMLDAVGGEIWLARPGDPTPQVFAVSADSVRAVVIERPRGGSRVEDGDRGYSAAMAVGAGWFYSGDFFWQDPSLEDLDSRKRVNALATHALLAADLHLGPARVGGGVEAWFTFGRDHKALSGDGAWRIRPYQFLSAGIPQFKLTLGYLLPYHAAVGFRGTIPLKSGIEIYLTGVYGLPGEWQYSDGARAPKEDIRILTVSAGRRF